MAARWRRRTRNPAAIRGTGALAALLAAASLQAAHSSELCVACIALRLERPVVARGPSAHEPDAPVSMIELPDGRFRAFAANATTIAIDAATPFALSGQSRVVLDPGPPGSSSECGRWLTTVMQGKDSLYGLIHDESHCRDGATYKSMSIARSVNDGLDWTVLGQVISADDIVVPGQAGGEGDCTAADGHDGYWYAYCLRLSDWKNTVARAPHDDPLPGKWEKWSGAAWNVPGLGGHASALSRAIGMSSAYWNEARAVLVLATSASMQLSLSRDKVHFETMSEPVVLYDANDWHRPAPNDFYAYPSMVAERGFNNIGRDFYLTYTYIPPGQDFTQRYLVVQAASIALAPVAQRPQIRTALSQWRSADGARWATTGPAISPPRSYTYDGPLGYLMTAPPQEMPSRRLDECFVSRAGAGFLAEAGACVAAGGVRRRAGGYVFAFEQPQTMAVYDCEPADRARFTSARADCDGTGARARLLGFALR